MPIYLMARLNQQGLNQPIYHAGLSGCIQSEHPITNNTQLIEISLYPRFSFKPTLKLQSFNVWSAVTLPYLECSEYCCGTSRERIKTHFAEQEKIWIPAAESANRANRGKTIELLLLPIIGYR